MTDEPAIELPLHGLVSAGQPVVAIEAREMLTVSARLVRGHARNHGSALYVRGDSMTGDRIDDGDLVVNDACPSAKNGDTATPWSPASRAIRRRSSAFNREPVGIRMQPANDAMAPLIFDQNDARSSAWSRVSFG